METDKANQKLQSTSSSSPILQRTSDFYDDSTYIHDYDRYDSVSAFSGSTVADSEFVQQQIRQFERENQTIEAKNPNTVYNLRIDKVVIDGNNKKDGIDQTAVNQIFSNFNKTPEKFSARKDTKWERVRNRARKPKFLFPSLMLLIFIMGLSIGLPLVMKNKDNKDDYVSDSTESSVTDATTTQSGETTTTKTQSTTTTTTTEAPFKLRKFNREQWEDEGLPLEGKYKQLVPIQKIILMNTMLDLEFPCIDEPSCTDVMVNLQQEAYPEFDDIQENFLIGMDGTVFEGRGLHREGQTTYDSLTSFNTQALSISFMTTINDKEPNSMQKETFCHFINDSIFSGDLSPKYKAFYGSALTSSYHESQDFNGDFGGCQVKLEKPPKIVKRRDWNAKEFPVENDFYFRRRSRNVIIAAEGLSCDSIETCSLIVKALQDSSSDEINFNFIFAGNNLIFEGRNFDAAVSNDFYDSLYLLVLGDVQTTQKGEEMFRNIKDFLSFAVDVSKLSLSYKLYGERQVKETSSPGDILFNFIKSDKEHFGENYEPNCSQECATAVTL